MHVCAPVVHDVTPEAQVLGLPVQDCPAVQATHAPEPSHTWLVPQTEPAERLPKSVQTEAPVAQLVMPVLHGVGLVVQLALAVHAPQVPAPSQTMLVPQLAPAVLLPPSVQVCVPVEQLVMPFLQGFVFVVHDWPALHAAQVPTLLQTMPTPQLVPGVLLVPSLHVVTLPEEQVVVPFLHGLLLPVQVWFAMQAPQKPLPSHSWPPVQVAVGGLFMPSMHTEAPVVHEVTPLRQTDGLFVHAIPAVHGTQVPVPLQT